MVGESNKIISGLRTTGKVYTVYDEIEEDDTNFETANQHGFTEDSRSVRSQAAATVFDLGKTLLQYAKKDDLKGVREMVARGAPLSSDWLGYTAIHYAAQNNNYEICQALIDTGINKDARTKVDRTPLHIAAFHGHERIVQLLISNKCNLNQKDMLRMTALHWAVEKGHKNIVRFLLKNNADVTVVSKFNRTPIAIAVLTEQADILQYLEAARIAQQYRTISEKCEKKTSEAVNFFTADENSDIIDEPESARKIDMDIDADCIRSNSNYISADHLTNVIDKSSLDTSAINLLKSHGISMMQDDKDTSNNLFDSALQNGRQLVLSEGGKMLLNKTWHSLSSPTNLRQKSKFPNIIQVKVNSESHMPPANLGLVSKAKDIQSKKIRIISINDFKKLYNGGDLKPLQNASSALLNRKSNPTEQNPAKKLDQFTDQSQNSNAAQIHLNNGAYTTDSNDLPSNIVQVSTDSSDECESDLQPQEMLAKSPNNNLFSKQLKANFQFVSYYKSNSKTKAIPVLTKSLGLKKSQTASIPLLSFPEICRQLLELRKQNEELRRKFDIAQSEKEEIRQRLERLEGAFMFEQTENNSDS